MEATERSDIILLTSTTIFWLCVQGFAHSHWRWPRACGRRDARTRFLSHALACAHPRALSLATPLPASSARAPTSLRPRTQAHACAPACLTAAPVRPPCCPLEWPPAHLEPLARFRKNVWKHIWEQIGSTTHSLSVLSVIKGRTMLILSLWLCFEGALSKGRGFPHPQAPSSQSGCFCHLPGTSLHLDAFLCTGLGYACPRQGLFFEDFRKHCLHMISA